MLDDDEVEKSKREENEEWKIVIKSPISKHQKSANVIWEISCLVENFMILKVSNQIQRVDQVDEWLRLDFQECNDEEDWLVYHLNGWSLDWDFSDNPELLYVRSKL